MKDFGKTLYNLFKNNNLPVDNSVINFMMGTLKTGLEIIHHNEETKKATSQEIVKAVENYIMILNDNKTFYTYRHSFLTLCKSDQFFKFFPQNFVYENWLKRELKQEEKPASTVHCKPDHDFSNIQYLNINCPDCNTPTLYLDNIYNCPVCTSCKGVFDNLKAE